MLKPIQCDPQSVLMKQFDRIGGSGAYAIYLRIYGALLISVKARVWALSYLGIKGGAAC